MPLKRSKNTLPAVKPMGTAIIQVIQ